MSEPQNALLQPLQKEFAANQNHHQSVFIQLLSAVLIVLAGYAIVFANTKIDAQLLDIWRDPKTNGLVSYSIMHVTGSFFIAEVIITLLLAWACNAAYSYRRDVNDMFPLTQNYSVFIKCLVVIHVMLIASLFIAYSENEKLHSFFANHSIIKSLLYVAIFIPLISSIILYFQSRRKYK